MLFGNLFHCQLTSRSIFLQTDMVDFFQNVLDILSCTASPHLPEKKNTRKKKEKRLSSCVYRLHTVNKQELVPVLQQLMLQKAGSKVWGSNPLGGTKLKFESSKLKIHTQNASQSHFYCCLKHVYLNPEIQRRAVAWRAPPMSPHQFCVILSPDWFLGATGPHGRLGAHSQVSSTSRIRLQGCCSDYLTNRQV